MPHSSVPIQYPQELLLRICEHIYCACLPSSVVSLDPLVSTNYDDIPTSLPSSFPAANWSEPVSRKTLANLCLVNHAWYDAAKPWLWTKLEVRLPRSWLALVEEIAWDYNEETVDQVMENTVRAAAQAAMRLTNPSDSEAQKFEESILDSINGPDEPIPMELLSPVATREPSPRRLRPKSKSPARWQLMRSISTAIQKVLEFREPGIYVPTPHDPRPGRFVRHLDFNHFRTIGMRRSVDEGVNSRFVTGDRVEAVLKETPNLTAFGATEYMDGALTLPVLCELFLRGTPSQGRGRSSRGRAQIDKYDLEVENRERRRQCKDLEAVDLTGCVSAVFVNALTEFVNTHLMVRGDDCEGISKQLLRTSLEDDVTFPGLRRLGLRGAKSILPDILSAFVLSFPFLTHLDISGTRATPELLAALAGSSTVRLTSLALARCVKLTSESIKQFLIDSPVTFGLKELNLYGDMTFVSPLTEEDLRDIVSLAPCFLSGELIYLDLSSSPVSRDILEACQPLPRLRSLGLSHILDLEVSAISNFIKNKASQVEILTLVHSCPELDCGLRPGAPNGAPRGSVRQSSLTLHTHVIRPLCTPPFSFSLTSTTVTQPPTRLRVIELSNVMLSGLGAGAGNWRIVKSKGGRGWYIDVSSGWVDGKLRRDLPIGHPLRVEMERLSEANGNVSSGVGWHARKMEILSGNGMLGREDGLYGAVSFAYH